MTASGVRVSPLNSSGTPPVPRPPAPPSRTAHGQNRTALGRGPDGDGHGGDPRGRVAPAGGGQDRSAVHSPGRGRGDRRARGRRRPPRRGGSRDGSGRP